MNTYTIIPLQSTEVNTVYYEIYALSYGNIIVASTDRGICYIGFHNSLEEGYTELQKRLKGIHLIHDTKDIHIQAVDVIEGQNQSPLILHIKGTTFQLQVWQALLSIPYGQTSNYATIAELISRPKAFRAVGTAIGKNPIAIIIPCHRIITKEGKMGNYHWGVDIKRVLLKEEKEKRGAVLLSDLASSR
jgi:AraC family transcriptional regulator, regulatory protein of adaptative response / methylated-DNA-[protein]-cysteine methyltransferase